MLLFKSHGPLQIVQQIITGKDVLRDCCLCPQHTIELQLKLKSLGKPLNPFQPTN